MVSGSVRHPPGLHPEVFELAAPPPPPEGWWRGCNNHRPQLIPAPQIGGTLTPPFHSGGGHDGDWWERSGPGWSHSGRQVKACEPTCSPGRLRPTELRSRFGAAECKAPVEPCKTRRPRDLWSNGCEEEFRIGHSFLATWTFSQTPQGVWRKGPRGRAVVTPVRPARRRPSLLRTTRVAEPAPVSRRLLIDPRPSPAGASARVLSRA